MTTWTIILLIGAAAFLMLEVMIPSFGVLGLLSAASYVFAVVLAFQQSPADGFVVAGVGLVVLPAAFLLGFRVMRRTPFGRKTYLGPPPEASIQRGFGEGMRALVGTRGTALTDLRPTGRADFGGVRVDVTAATAFVKKDTPVTVLRVEGARIVVEPSTGPSEGPETP